VLLVGQELLPLGFDLLLVDAFGLRPEELPTQPRDLAA
jgi:hypothetical protein